MIQNIPSLPSLAFDSHKWANGIQSMLDRTEPFRAMHEKLAQLAKVQQRVSSLSSLLSASLLSANRHLPAMPKSAIDALNLIKSQQDRFGLMMERVKPYNSVFDALISQQAKFDALIKHSRPNGFDEVLRQFKSLQVASSHLSNSIAQRLVASRDWQNLEQFGVLAADIMDQYEDTSEAAVSIDDFGAFKAKIEADLAHLIQIVNKLGKDKLSRFSAWVTIVSFLLCFRSIIDSYVHHPEAVTLEQVIQLNRELTEQVKRQLTDTQLHRIIARQCAAHLKPCSNSLTITSLPSGTDVVVITSNHKWLYISFTDPKDGFAQTGWVLKKYLKNQSDNGRQR